MVLPQVSDINKGVELMDEQNFILRINGIIKTKAKWILNLYTPGLYIPARGFVVPVLAVHTGNRGLVFAGV